MEVNKVVSGQ